METQTNNIKTNVNPSIFPIYSLFYRPPAIIAPILSNEENEKLTLTESTYVTTDKGARIKVIGSPYAQIKSQCNLVTADYYTTLRMYLNINEITYKELEPITKQDLIWNIPFVIKGITHNFTIAKINGSIVFLAEDLDKNLDYNCILS